VAPFKAQNMSLNSYVTVDHGEMGRAQVVQAQAAGVVPEVKMNPVLLKPGTDTTSQIIVLGRPVGELDAARGWHGKHDLLEVVIEAHRDLQQRFDVVICEGAGSPAEINLRSSDIVNLGFARASNVPALLVSDIDRGGAFASLVGTLAVLEPGDQDLVRGFIINKFRGSKELLGDGIDQLRALTGRSTLGILPLLRGLEIDAEDATDFTSWADGPAPLGDEVLTVGVVALPRASNLTDVDPLVDEPGVVLRALYRPEQMQDCDIVILPGTRATVNDMNWLRSRGFEAALRQRTADRRPIFGICGGYQMLGTSIEDTVESRSGRVAGFGLLPVRTVFHPQKLVAQTRQVLDDGAVIHGYQIHHGRVVVEGGHELFVGEGCVDGSVAGSTWHGLFENDDWRRRFLTEVAASTGRRFIADTSTNFAHRREERIDALADLIEEHLDTDSLRALLDNPFGDALSRVTLRLQS
jgi:adenosylcobyric acid synthase